MKKIMHLLTPVTSTFSLPLVVFPPSHANMNSHNPSLHPEGENDCCLDGAIVKIVEIFMADHPNSMMHQLFHHNCGYAYASVLSLAPELRLNIIDNLNSSHQFKTSTFNT